MDQNEYLDMEPQHTRNGGRGSDGDRIMLFGGVLIGMLVAFIISGAMLGISLKTGVLATGNSKKQSGVLNPQVTVQPSGQEEKGGLVLSNTESKLNALITLIDQEFFLEGATHENMEEGIYKGLLASLGDPYSEYYTAEEFTEMLSDSKGVYTGIGAYIGLDSSTKLPKIAGVFRNSPAESVDLRANDLVYMVNGERMQGLTLSEAVRKIRGEEGTQVTLTIVRDTEQMEKVVTRAKVENPTVEYEMLEDQMGYLRITEFDDVTTQQFADAMAELNDNGMKGLILDLRANPGGNLTTVVEVAQQILPEGIVVYTEDKNNQRVNFRCKGDKELKTPLVVLVDMNSASAAEILSGAIQDYGIGTLVGTTTFGKGIVQTIIPLKDGSAVKITTSGYFTPKGRSIHKIGIEPDIVVEFDGTQYYNVENPVDNQLEKAKEVLKEKMK